MAALIASRPVRLLRGRRALVALAVIAVSGVPYAAAQPPEAIERVKPSIVAVGTFQKTRVPQFRFRGTGFALDDGTLVATNAHVLPDTLDTGADPEFLAVARPSDEAARAVVRRASRLAVDGEHDLALVRIEGPSLPALVLRDSSAVREGENLLFTGFPIGTALGLFPATHRAMVAAIAPVAIPSGTARQLDAKVIRRLREKAFPIFQLDGTAFPGNSGSPLYDPASGEVVGIVNMVFVRSTREAALTDPSGITYAVPSRFLIELLARSRR